MNFSKVAASDLLVMLDITRRLAEQRMVQPLIDYVASTVFELVPAERCMVVLFDEQGQPVVQIARNRQGESLGGSTDQMSRSILERVRATMTPLHVADALSESSLQSSRSVRSLGLRSVICVPLVSYGQAVGAIYVENRSARGQFSEDNLVPLVLLSHQVVIALENARTYEALEARIADRTRALEAANAQLERQAAELREQSVRDSLTGLYNRRYFGENLTQLFELARRYDRPLSLACLDIDHFKQINDRYFHSGGDRALTAVAHLLRDQIRMADTIARIGGEEFVVVMPELSLPGAAAAAERLRAAVEQNDWEAVIPGLRVTVSVGVADDVGCSDALELLRRADTRLYAAKHAGRNRVVATEPEE